MILDRLKGLLRPTHDPEITRLRKKVSDARKALDDRLDKDGGTRDVARAMLEAIEEAKRA